MTPSEEGDILRLSVVHSDLAGAVGEAEGGRGQFAICWTTGSAPEQNADPSWPTVTVSSQSPARLGVLSFAGPKAASDQLGGQTVLLGVPARVQLLVVGAPVGRLTDLESTGLPTSFREVRLVPSGQCGIALAEHTAVLRLTSVSLGEGAFIQGSLVEKQMKRGSPSALSSFHWQ